MAGTRKISQAYDTLRYANAQKQKKLDQLCELNSSLTLQQRGFRGNDVLYQEEKQLKVQISETESNIEDELRCSEQLEWMLTRAKEVFVSSRPEMQS
jgi:hypothetical protein